jgi:hypothetical protein
MSCELDELETALPSVERLRGQAFLGTELRDCQAAASVAAHATAPERTKLEVAGSRHGTGSGKGTSWSALQATTPRKAGNFGRLHPG